MKKEIYDIEAYQQIPVPNGSMLHGPPTSNGLVEEPYKNAYVFTKHILKNFLEKGLETGPVATNKTRQREQWE